MAEAWTYLLTGGDPLAIAAVLAFVVIMAIILTWPWGLYDDFDEE